MATALFLANKFEWFGDAVLLLLVLIAADRFLGFSPEKMLRILLRELPELLDRDWTAGSMNAFGLVVVLLAGIVISSDVMGTMLSVLSGLLGDAKAHEYMDSATPVATVLALAALAALSTFFVALSQRRSRP